QGRYGARSTEIGGHGLERDHRNIRGTEGDRHHREGGEGHDPRHPRLDALRGHAVAVPLRSITRRHSFCGAALPTERWQCVPSLQPACHLRSDWSMPASLRPATATEHSAPLSRCRGVSTTTRNRASPRTAVRPKAESALPGARPGPLPTRLLPQLAEPAERVPEGR